MLKINQPWPVKNISESIYYFQHYTWINNNESIKTNRVEENTR